MVIQLLTISSLIAGNNVYSFVLPKNVSLGMTEQQMKEVRPTAKRQGSMDVDVPRDKMYKSILAEFINEGNEVTSYQYCFTNETLCSVTMSVFLTPGVQDKRAKNIYKSLISSFIKVKDEKIVRLSGNLEKSVVTAELWKDKMTKTHLFFVATTEETTVILFDPALFSYVDFFILADNVPKEISVTKMIRDSATRSEKNKVKDISRSDLIKEEKSTRDRK